MSSGPAADVCHSPTPDEVVGRLIEQIEPVGLDAVVWPEAAGRVLGQSVHLDRPSPACDVSAMDGYAVRLPVAREVDLFVDGESQAGRPAPAMPDVGVLRVFTGAPVPAGADAVVRREDVEERGQRIRVAADVTIQHGQNIRRCGENAAAGDLVLRRGGIIGPAALAAAAACGCDRLQVHRRVRLAIVVTGDEVLEPGEPVQPWQLRDSNGPGLAAMFSPLPWIHLVPARHLSDDLSASVDVLQSVLPEADAVLVTGGVSAGDYDFVPEALRQAGARTVFHRLPIRPGKPLLGAIGPEGQPVFGLPGNPVSVLVTARRFALQALRSRAGQVASGADGRLVDVETDDRGKIALHWFRLVRLAGAGVAHLVPSRGSGDIIAAAQSDGFLEIPPSSPAAGRRVFYPWSISG